MSFDLAMLEGVAVNHPPITPLDRFVYDAVRQQHVSLIRAAKPVPAKPRELLTATDFFGQLVVSDETGEVPFASVHNAYLSWCERVGTAPLSTQLFNRRMDEIGAKRKRKTNGNFYTNVIIRKEMMA